MKKKYFVKKYLFIIFINIPIWFFIIYIDGGMGTVSLSNIFDLLNDLKNPFFLFWSLVFYFGFCFFMTKGIYEKKKNIWLRSSKMILVGVFFCLGIISIMIPISFINNELFKWFLLSFLLIIIIFIEYIIIQKKIILYEDGTVIIRNVLKRYKFFKEDIKDIYIYDGSNKKYLKIILLNYTNYNIRIIMGNKDITNLKQDIVINFKND